MEYTWIFKRFRWAYLLLVSIIILQSYLLFLDDPRYIILMSLSLIPGMAYITYVRYSDVGEKEPRGAVAFGIFLGILLIYPAIFLENYGISIINKYGYHYSKQYFSNKAIIYLLLLSFPVISLVEEGLKFLAFFISFSFSKENDQPTDSIVYAVAISGGFALFENYRYVINAANYTFEQGYIVALARTLTAIPLHLGLGLLMGVYLSQFFNPDKLEKPDQNRYNHLINGFLVPVLLHGLYDFIIFASFPLLPYLDIALALLFAIILSIYAWKKTIELRERVAKE